MRRHGNPFSRSPTLFLAIALVFEALIVSSQPAQAACIFFPTPGDDTYVCDSGTSAGGLTDLGGNNTLLLPVGGTGTVNGDVSFGSGRDSIEVHSGTISGSVDEDGGRDSFIMSDGIVTGSVDQGARDDTFVISGGTVTGRVDQGRGVDYFEMTGGQIESLYQGPQSDSFLISGGRIVNELMFGDEGVMTGGRIGRINLWNTNNRFTMSGGTIDGDLLAITEDRNPRSDNDTIELSGGTIGGNIVVGKGTDSLTMTGGSVGGNVSLGPGNDTFTWDGGGIVSGAVDLGEGDDTASIGNLTDAHIGATTQIAGGTGTDRLTLDNVQTGGVARFDSWESLDLRNNTQLLFDNTLVLGDSGTATGSFTIDATSTVFGGNANGGISAFTAGQLAEVINSGRIDLTNGGDSTSDSFTIGGNYRGNGGLLFFNTVLGDDSSESDKLVVDGGTASGTTGMGIVNVGGKGDATTRDGIMVIQAVNGGTSDSGAFALNGRVAAGAYEYFLFKGGVTVGTEENWYLRSELVAPLPPPTPTPPPTPPPTPTPTPAPGTPDLPSPVPDGPPIPLYSIKVPTYAVIPPVARHLVLSTLGTFHERRGEQALLRGSGYLPASWGRVFGQDAEMKWDGTVAPSFDGNFFGFQVGEDLLSSESITGHFDHVGLFVGHARVQGDVKGQALGWNDLAVGNVGVRGNGLGGYWTHIGPQGWYLDGVLMGVWLSGDASADSGESIDSDGTGATASLEGGYPIALTQQWTLEPQAQLIWQHLSLDGQADRFSSVSFDTDDTLAGRLGSRLWGNFQTGTGTIQLYLKANLWHNFSADETVRFDGDPIVTELDGTSVEVGGGIVASLTENFSLFATADYTTNLGSEKTRILGGNLGASIKW